MSDRTRTEPPAAARWLLAGLRLVAINNHNNSCSEQPWPSAVDSCQSDAAAEDTRERLAGTTFESSPQFIRCVARSGSENPVASGRLAPEPSRCSEVSKYLNKDPAAHRFISIFCHSIAEVLHPVKFRGIVAGAKSSIRSPNPFARGIRSQDQAHRCASTLRASVKVL